MHTNESRRHAERLMSTLGAFKGVEPGKIGDVEKFNPYHDERGRFTFAHDVPGALGAVKRAATKRSEDSLWQHNEDYHHAAEKAKRKGEKGPFLYYIPKGQFEGEEPENWKKHNSKIGELEAKSNAMERWLKIPSKSDTQEKRMTILAAMQTFRDAAKQHAKARDRIKKLEPKTEETWIAEKAKLPPLLQDIFDTISETQGPGDAAFSPEEIREQKEQVVQIAVDSGLISEEEGKEILSEMEA